MLREREVEGGALADHRIEPDSPAVAVDDFLADRQTDSRSGIFARMNAPEGLEDVVELLGGDADAVVFDGELPVAVAG